MADPKRALLSPGVRHLKEIVDFSNHLASLTGLPPRITATENGLMTAIERVAQSNPLSEADEQPVRLINTHMPNKDLAKAVKTHNDVVAHLIREPDSSPSHATRKYVAAAYPGYTEATINRLASNWLALLADMKDLPKYAHLDALSHPEKLVLEDVQREIDTGNSHYARIKWGSTEGHLIASRQDAIRLAHAVLERSGQIPVEISDRVDIHTKKATTLTLPFNRKEFESRRLETIAKACEQTVRTRLSSVTATGSTEDPFKAALITPYVSAHGLYCLGAYFIANDGSGKISFKSCILHRDLNKINLSKGDRLIAARTIFASGVNVEKPDWLTSKSLNAISHDSNVLTNYTDTKQHLYGVLCHFNPELRLLTPDQQAQLTSPVDGTSFLDNLIMLRDRHTNLAYLGFRENLSEVDNCLIRKHVQVNTLPMTKDRKPARLSDIASAIVCIATIPNREPIIAAMVTAPFASILFRKSFGYGQELGIDELHAISKGTPLVKAMKEFFGSNDGSGASPITNLHTRTIKTMLKVPVDKALPINPSKTLRLIDNYYRASPRNPELTSNDFMALHELENLTSASRWIPNKPLSAAAYVNAFRNEKGSITPPSDDVAEAITYLADTVGAITGSSDQAAAQRDEALEQIIAPHGATYARLERIHDQWHNSIDRHAKNLDAFLDDLKAPIMQEQFGPDAKRLLASYPVPRTEPTSVNGVVITPLTGKDKSFADAGKTNDLITLTRHNAKYGHMLVFSLESETGKSTAAYRFYPVQSDSLPTQTLFSRFDHVGIDGKDLPQGHEQAANDYIRNIIDDKTRLHFYNTAVLQLQFIQKHRSTVLPPESQKKLAEFQFEQLKEFLPPGEQGMTRDEWLQKLTNDVNSRIIRDQKAADRTEARKAEKRSHSVRGARKLGLAVE